MLRLLSLLQDHRERSALELAETLGVTTRTVRRDVTRLRDLGYPVDITPGRSGYMLGIGGQLPPLLLDDDEAFAVAHGLRLVATAPVEGVEDAALAALRKLDGMLPPQVRERVRALDIATVHVDASTGPPVSIDSLIALATACRESERTRFSYQDHGGTETARRVDPHRLVHVAGRWYLVADDCDRHDWRTFRVDRISNLERTGHTFVAGDLPDAARRVIEGILYTSHPHTAEVLVDVEPSDARRRYSSFAVIVPTGDGRSVLRIGSYSVDQIARHVASMSCEWKVLRPPELVDALVRHANRVRRFSRK